MMAYLLTGLVLGVLLVAADWAESMFIACVALWPLVLIGLVVDWCKK